MLDNLVDRDFEFQSTLSIQRVTTIVNSNITIDIISIHTLYTESDRC